MMMAWPEVMRLKNARSSGSRHGSGSRASQKEWFQERKNIGKQHTRNE
jgi:hypothetical protein